MEEHVDVTREIEAVSMEEGAGARVRRLFPTEHRRHLDPFVLLDEFTVTPPAAFPEHPHGGFEAVTYMLDGAFRHRDDLGNDQTVSAGGVQRFTAGKRIVHAELPGGEATSHGLQLWVNLPRDLKELEPDYQAVPAEDIPDSEIDGGIVRTVIGEESPVRLHTRVRYTDVAFKPGPDRQPLRYEGQIPLEWNGLVYVLEGTIGLPGTQLTRGRAILFEGGGRLEITAQGASRFVVIAGVPHREPIHQRGSFVL